MKTKYQIYDNGRLVPAFTRKPKDARAIKLETRDATERKLGIKYFIPASELKASE